MKEKKHQRELYIARKENMSKEKKDKMKERWRKNSANQRARMAEKKKQMEETHLQQFHMKGEVYYSSKGTFIDKNKRQHGEIYLQLLYAQTNKTSNKDVHVYFANNQFGKPDNRLLTTACINDRFCSSTKITDMCETKLKKRKCEREQCSSMQNNITIRENTKIKEQY